MKISGTAMPKMQMWLQITCTKTKTLNNPANSRMLLIIFVLLPFFTFLVVKLHNLCMHIVFDGSYGA